jgi:hypothetical protein
LLQVLAIAEGVTIREDGERKHIATNIARQAQRHADAQQQPMLHELGQDVHATRAESGRQQG